MYRVPKADGAPGRIDQHPCVLPVQPDQSLGGRGILNDQNAQCCLPVLAARRAVRAPAAAAMSTRSSRGPAQDVPFAADA